MGLKGNLLFSLFLSFLIWTPALAGQVLRAKDNRALLDISSLTGAQVGEELKVLDESGRRTGVVRIRAIRANQALAEVIQGTALERQQIRRSSGGIISRPEVPATSPAPSTPRARQTAPAKTTPYGETFSKNGAGIGGFITQANHALSIELQSKTRANLKGSSMNFGGLYDYDYTDNWTVRLALILLQFNVKGNSPSATDCAGTCDIKFNYLSGSGMIQYNFSRGGNRYWAGVGANLMFQMSQSNNLNGTKFTNNTNQNFSLGAGADFGLTSTSYIPVFFSYDLFMGANSANSLHLGLGYAVRF